MIFVKHRGESTLFGQMDLGKCKKNKQKKNVVDKMSCLKHTVFIDISQKLLNFAVLKISTIDY